MSASNQEYLELFGNIQIQSECLTMARCACVACNSCTCACSCRACPDWEDFEW